MVKSTDHAGRVIEYTYNSRGQMDTLTDPEGRVTEFDYDARGLPVQVAWDNQHVMNQQFDALGRLVEREAPNGVVTSHSYDELSQVQEIEHRKSNQTVISSFDYEYDQAGNIVSITEANSAAFEYGYDETDQLVKEIRYDDTGDTVYGRAYQYDPVGNRLVKEDLVSGDTVGYTYGADNRMLSAGDISFSYDIGGNMIEKDDNGDTVAYEWDEGNNLSKVTLSDGTSMELTYDGDDIRASRVIDGEEVRFAWDPQSFNVVGEYDDMGNEDVAYGPQIGMDDPWVMERESDAYFFQTDHLNSVTELTDENEAVQNEYRYKAFGEALQAVEMVENEYQFTARRQDGVDGIQFNRFRHYQAQFGRWMRWDVIRYGDGPNMYGYVGNAPVVFVDANGMFIQDGLDSFNQTFWGGIDRGLRGVGVDIMPRLARAGAFSEGFADVWTFGSSSTINQMAGNRGRLNLCENQIYRNIGWWSGLAHSIATGSVASTRLAQGGRITRIDLYHRPHHSFNGIRRWHMEGFRITPGGPSGNHRILFRFAPGQWIPGL